MASPVCSHLDRISVTSLLASMAGCEESNRHARRHAGDAGHPIARSAGPGEDWSWCFLDEVAFNAGWRGVTIDLDHRPGRVPSSPEASEPSRLHELDERPA